MTRCGRTLVFGNGITTRRLWGLLRENLVALERIENRSGDSGLTV